jgi:hypothetical protein
MEDDDTKNSDAKAPEELSPSTANINADNNPQKPEKRNRKSQPQKRKTLRQYFRNANAFKKFEMSLLALGSAIGIAYVGVTVWGNLQTKWHFETEHRPRVIVSRPPELVGTFECYVTDKAIHLHSGAMHVWVKNIRKGDAIGAFVEGPQFKLVPEQKIGNPFYDDLPSITEETCKQKVSPKMKAFPVHGGQEVSVNMVQSIGTLSLIKTNSVSITFGGPQQEPETPAGEKPSERVPLTKDTIFQLYGPVCVYYFDEDGTQYYGSCRNYRLSINGRGETSDPYAFSCSQTPISGTFEETFFGYCEN